MLINNIYLYNTKTRIKEQFYPINKTKVKFYVCGPTVYDYIHLGNARSLVIFDLLFRVLRAAYGADNILYIRNITDVDDKIIKQANKLKITCSELVEKNIKAFIDDANYLKLLSPSFQPRATRHIQDIINIIKILLSKGYAYLSEGSIYFDTSKAKDYHVLSGRSFEEMQEGYRIEVEEKKKNPADFILWKPVKLHEEEACFDSPWGKGRPGWHIECSAMSYAYLGENFDIHGGGADLIFPHHTNEIAQSTCAFSGSNFANYWVHNGFLTVGGAKMSKSLNNFITVESLRRKGVKGQALRLALLSSHYHKPMDFNFQLLENMHKMLHSWRSAIYLEKDHLPDFLLDIMAENENIDHKSQLYPAEFFDAISDNLNMPIAIKVINDYAKAIYKIPEEKEKNIFRSKLLIAAKFLGFDENIVSIEPLHENDSATKEIEEIIKKRSEAKKNKNWSLADQLREELEKNYRVILQDSRSGETKWYYIDNDYKL